MRLHGMPPTRLMRALRLVNEPGVECEKTPGDWSRGEHVGPALRAMMFQVHAVQTGAAVSA